MVQWWISSTSTFSVSRNQSHILTKNARYLIPVAQFLRSSRSLRRGISRFKTWGALDISLCLGPHALSSFDMIEMDRVRVVLGIPHDVVQPPEICWGENNSRSCRIRLDHGSISASCRCFAMSRKAGHGGRILRSQRGFHGTISRCEAHFLTKIARKRSPLD